MKRLQLFLVIVGFVGLMLSGTGCERPQSASPRIPKQQATKAATSNAAPATNATASVVMKTGADKQAQCAQRLQQAEQQIQDLTNELRVTYVELEQEQTKVDDLLDENQNLNEQVQGLTKQLMAAKSKSNGPEKAPGTP